MCTLRRDRVSLEEQLLHLCINLQSLDMCWNWWLCMSVHVPRKQFSTSPINCDHAGLDHPSLSWKRWYVHGPVRMKKLACILFGTSRKSELCVRCLPYTLQGVLHEEIVIHFLILWESLLLWHLNMPLWQVNGKLRDYVLCKDLKRHSVLSFSLCMPGYSFAVIFMLVEGWT